MDEALLDAAAEALVGGLVVGVPTETVYGLAVDPRSPEAVDRLVALKGRAPDQPIGLLGTGAAAFGRLARLDGRASAMAAAHWPGPLTMVVPARGMLAVGDPQRRTIGLRVPDHPVALALLGLTGPLAVTSANRSGEPAVVDDGAARALFGEAVAVYLPGVAEEGSGSTVVDLTTDPPTVLRSGPLSIRF